jgi:predicted acyl esterase
MSAAILAMALLGPILLGSTARGATPGRFSEDMRFTTSDGVSLQTTLTGSAPPKARPVIVEFSPYGRGSGTFSPSSAYNFLLVQIRGTGDSDGQFDALGPRTQSDVTEVLNWACHQPWSNGSLGLNGFSASAITVYNSLHLHLPCVRTATLKSGTFELYRDLLWPGGISNSVPGLGVLGLIGAPATAQSPSRLGRNPGSAPGVAAGLIDAGVAGGLQHPTLDTWWQDRSFRGDVNHLPILMIDGFFDVESRGAFQAFQALRGDGAHLLVVGAHDGSPAGTDGGVGETQAWFDHYLEGVPNDVQRHPVVQTWMSDGDRLAYLGGRYVRYDGSDWPIPGTRWMPMYLSAARSGTAKSLNDGTLTTIRPGTALEQSYPDVASGPSMTDPPNTAIVGGDGLNALAAALPSSEQMNTAEADGLSFTTAPLAGPLLSAGPFDLDVRMASTAPGAGIWAVISDVGPDGSAHPLTVGRLLDSYPRIDPTRSLYDPSTGQLVQPYGVFSQQTPPAAGQQRLYHVEFWPVGNRFEPGHRLRLDLVGASAASKPATSGLDTIRVGGSGGAVLEVPVLPQSQPG